jgi:organic hydroperoxide reductase OsmC/OhrA
MQPFPHHYAVSARLRTTGTVLISSPGLSSLETAPPPSFGGPEGFWSPETLLTAAVADCFILTFRAIARASRFEWTGLECHVEATLDRIDGQSRFVRYTTTATLTLPAGADEALAQRLLHKAEQGCLVANSLHGERTLVANIRFA